MTLALLIAPYMLAAIIAALEQTGVGNNTPPFMAGFPKRRGRPTY